MVKPIAGNRQPPLGKGWGIFSWRNGEFSPGVDTTPVQDNTLADQPSLFVAFPQGSTNYPTYPSSQAGLIISVRAARNPSGFLDKISSSPNTWQTYIYYNAADEKNGTKCPVPTIQNTFRNLGLPGSPLARWAVSQLTIIEQ